MAGLHATVTVDASMVRPAVESIVDEHMADFVEKAANIVVGVLLLKLSEAGIHTRAMTPIFDEVRRALNAGFDIEPED